MATSINKASSNKKTPAAIPTPAAWPRVAVESPAGPAPAAVSAFETAMRDLQKHKFAEAAKRLKALLADFPGERALLDRVRVYLDLCVRELERRPTAPKTVEERLTLATAALNNGDDTAAERLASGVLSDTPHHDLALYLLAAVHARRGDTSSALQRLQQALLVSPDIRAQARHDPDFERLRSLAVFQELMEPPANGFVPPPSAALPRRGGKRVPVR